MNENFVSMSQVISMPIQFFSLIYNASKI